MPSFRRTSLSYGRGAEEVEQNRHIDKRTQTKAEQISLDALEGKLLDTGLNT